MVFTDYILVDCFLNWFFKISNSLSFSLRTLLALNNILFMFFSLSDTLEDRLSLSSLLTLLLRSLFYLVRYWVLSCKCINFCSIADMPCWLLDKKNKYALRNMILFFSSSSISLNLIVSSSMLSLYTSSSEMVVNLIEVLILLFSFLTSSSSYLC